MNISSKPIFKLALFIALFLTFKGMMGFFALQSFNGLEVEGWISAQSHITLQTTNGLHKLSSKTGGVSKPTEQLSSEETFTSKRQFGLHNTLIEKLALVIEEPGQTQIDRITLNSYFSHKPVIIEKDQLAISHQKDKGKLVIVTLEPISITNPFLGWAIPFFLAFAALSLATTSLLKLPSVADTFSNQQLRNPDNLASLDGLRGIAAILVLLNHSTATFTKAGTVGVFLFFVLSGFLLSKPFVMEPQLSLDKGFMHKYMIRRLKRIVPMYYFMILCLFSIQSYHDTALRHFLFIQGDGHFWTIVQELYFYLLLPFIAALLYISARKIDGLKILILILVAIIWVTVDSSKIILLYGQNHQMRAFFEVFIIGMAGSYFYYGLYQKNPTLQTWVKQKPIVTTTIGWLIFIFLLLASTNLELMKSINFNPYQQPILTSILCLCTVILASVGGNSNWFKRALSFTPFRYIGVIGYSFYLIHPYSIFMVRNAIESYYLIPWSNVSNTWITIAALLLTTVLASMTYSLIERPFLTKPSK